MRTLLFIVWLWIFGIGYAAESVSSDSAAPLWSADEIQDSILRRNGGAPLLIDSNRAGVTFLDNQRLLLHEALRDTGQLSSRQSPDISSSHRLHLSILEADSGKMVLVKDWGTRVHESSVQATTGGVLVQTGEILRFLSKDFTELQQTTLVKGSGEGHPIVSVSPTRKTFMINRFNQRSNISRFEDLQRI
jgi:hypothetical protein